jgi:CelD/BcsL family acetyltransferase involved in cellulose biosynthesis
MTHGELVPEVDSPVREQRSPEWGRRIPTEAVQVEAIDEEAARTAWTALAAASGNVFSTMEFIETWQQWVGDPALRLASIRSADHRFVGLLALVIDQRGPLRILRFAGHGMADLMGPIGSVDDTRFLSAGLRAYLAMSERYDLFIGERMFGGWDWATDLDAAELGREGFPLIRFTPGEGWEDFVARLSKRQRSNVRREPRALAKLGEVHVHRTEDAAQLPGDFDRFMALHKARFSNESSLVAKAEFLRSFADVALERGWLRLSLLELNGQAVAALYDLQFAEVYAGYNGGRDPAFDHASVGGVLRACTLQGAIEDGLREYRFLRGGEAYKYRFANEDPGVVTIGRARTPMGAAALAGIRFARSQEGLRSVLRRFG